MVMFYNENLPFDLINKQLKYISLWITNLSLWIGTKLATGKTLHAAERIRDNNIHTKTDKETKIYRIIA